MNTVSSIWRKRAAQPVLSVFFGLVLVLQTASPITALAQEAPAPDSAPQEQTQVVEDKNEGEQEQSARFFNQNHETQICHKIGQGQYEEITLKASTSFGLNLLILAHKLHGDIHPVPENGCPGSKETGTLTLIKVVEGGQGQGSAGLWTLYANGEEDNLSGSTPVSGEVEVGEYDLSESGPEGYTASDWNCVLDTDSVDVSAQMEDADTVVVSEGQDITCTITNTFNTPDPEEPNLHFIKVVCDQYSDIVGNENASSEDDTDGNYTQFKNGSVTKPVTPAEIPSEEDGCYRADGWSFLLSTDIDQESNTQVVGPTVDGEYVTPVTGEDSVLNEALQEGIENGAFWVSEVEQDGYGFAALRCYNDALNGDNLEFVNLGQISPNTPSDIYCIAYNVSRVPDTEPCGTELIDNGGFETPEIKNSWDIVDNGTTDLGWSVEWMPSIPGGAPDPASLELHRGVNGWAPQEGQQHAELDGDWGGPSSGQSGEDGSTKIYQNLATVPGHEYTISYWTSPRPGIADNQVRFSWDGNVVETVVENGSANSNTVWTQHTHTLVANDSVTTVEFADLSAGDSLGSFIDNVSVVEECPDPCNSEEPTKPGILAAVVDFIDDAIKFPYEEDCISTISGMKYNDLNGNGVKDGDETGLAGWEIYAYNGIPSSNITVDSADITGSDTNAVDAGMYVVMARGTWNNGGAQYFDTEFHTPDSWVTHEDGVVPYGTDIGDIVINDTQFVDWGVYNDQNENGFGHYYFYILNHPGGNINYSVFDGTGGVKNAGWYGDNTGSINIQMYKLLDTAVTDASGNYTLEFNTDEPVTAVVREVQQNGWTQTSPNSSTGVYALNGLIEGVNYPVTGNWNFIFEAEDRNVTGADFGNHYVGYEEENRCEDIKYVSRDQATVLTDYDDQYPNEYPDKECAISGYKYEDIDGDGEVDEGEDGLAGWRIYIDIDGDNQYDIGEPYDYTDSNGYYSFNYLSAGTYTIREENQSGWSSTYPSTVDVDNEHVVNLVLNSVTGRDFLNEPQDEPCEEVSEEVSLFSSSDTDTAGYTTGPLNNDSDGLNATNYSGGGFFTDSVATTYIGAWIDPTTNGSFSGSGAVWISTDLQHPGDEGGEGSGDDNQWRLFQTKFTVPSGATVTPGTLYFSADNAVSVYLNGTLIDDTSEDLVTYGPNVAIPEVFKNVYSVALNPVVGENTLSFVVRNSSVPDIGINPTGLLYNGDFSYVVDCDEDGGGDGDNGGGGSRSSGSGSNRSGRVLGDTTSIPYQDPRILGEQLPRTGAPLEAYAFFTLVSALASFPMLRRKRA